MKVFNSLLALAYLSAGFIAEAAPQSNNGKVDSNTTSPKTFEAMKARYNDLMKKELNKRGSYSRCNAKNVRVRKEWGSMSATDRIAYTDAVKCLHSLPPKSSPADVPGARSRFDDFVAAHIEQAYNIHFGGNLFVWHRAYTWYFETALREECGYQGTQPYWDWSLYADDPASSPLFDGSATSIGGNGESIVHGPTLLKAFGLEVSLPPGTGGGCVTKGPMANWTVNLGLTPPVPRPAQELPLPIPVNETDSPASSSALDYNPRCLTRDINLQWSAQTKKSDVEHVLACTNVDCLGKRADGWEFDRSQPQPMLHSAGHFTIGGLANDPFASPGDPAFYFHHAQFDHMWAIWQAQDWNKRKNEVDGTKTPFNEPPSEKVTLNDQLVFEAAAPNIKIRDAMSPIDGRFCYIYE